MVKHWALTAICWVLSVTRKANPGKTDYCFFFEFRHVDKVDEYF